MRSKFDWIAFIDADEFITFGSESSYKNINDYLSSIRTYNVIFINWMYYGDNENICQKKEDVIKRFPLPIKVTEENKHVKSIIKTSADICFVRNPHCPDGDIQICDDCQQVVFQNEPFKQPSYKMLYIRHYGTKTIEEFIKNKMLRGAADRNINPYTIDLFYKINKRSKEKREVEKKYFHIQKQRESTPLVSIIIPNFNHKRYLNQRIESVLSQTFKNFELILLDDCSNDNSQKLLLSYKENPHISYIIINTKNSGSPFIQWEKGIRLAKGKYIWIAESDDSADPNFLEYTVTALESNPDATICLTGSTIIDGKNNYIQTDEFDHWEIDGKAHLFQSIDYLRTHMMNFNAVYNASMVLFRKEKCLLNITRKYREMHYCGDWLFWIEQIKKGKVIEIHEKLNYFRKDGNNTTNKGAIEGNSLGEIALIKNILYKSNIFSKKEINKDKYDYYRAVKYFPVSTSKRKKELFKIIARESNISYKHYIQWKLYKLLQKIRKKCLIHNSLSN